jgi:hypothetical protein
MIVFRAFVILLFLATLVGSVAAQREQDPCEPVRSQLSGGNAPDLTLAEIRQNAACYDNAFIRVIGIYRASFENSDLYYPDDGKASAWINFDPFYSAIKHCSAANLKTLNRKDDGTFGFIALGVIKTKGSYGHMNGWDFEFQPICLERVELLSKSGAVFPSQTKETQKKILTWHKQQVRKLY